MSPTFLSAGFGIALTFIPAVVMIGEYFDEHLTVANGIAFSGGSIGQICMPLITSALINSYGWRGAILILSAICSNLLVSGALIRHKLTDKSVTEGKDSKVPEYVNPAFEGKEIDSETPVSSDKNGSAAIATNRIVDENKPIAYIYTKTHPEIPTCISKSMQKEPITAIIWSTGHHGHWEKTACKLKTLFRNISFDLMLVIFFLYGVLFYAPVSHAIPRALEAGITESKAAVLPTMFGIGSLIGKVAPTFIADFLHISRGKITAFAFGICSLANLLNPLFSAFWQHALYHIIYGTASGTQTVLLYTIIQVIIPQDLRVFGVGFGNFIDSIGYGVGALCVGKLKITVIHC